MVGGDKPTIGSRPYPSCRRSALFYRCCGANHREADAAFVEASFSREEPAGMQKATTALCIVSLWKRSTPANGQTACWRHLSSICRSTRRLNGKPELPRSANVIDAELVCMAWPMRCCVEPCRTCVSIAWVARAELVVDRVHQVLADTPRVGLSHVRSRRHD